jgi:hypothetical protein
MSEHKHALLSIIFAGLCACDAICIMAVALGPMDLPGAGDPGRIVWRETARMRVDEPPFHPGETLRYRIAWKGVPCAEFRTTLRTERRDDREWLVVEYAGQTGSVIQLLWSFSTAGETWLNPRTLLPSHGVRVSREKDEVEVSWTRFDRLSRNVTEIKMESDDEEPDCERIAFVHGLDLPATFLMIRALDWDTPGSRTLELVHGDEAYALEMVPDGKQLVQTEAGLFEALAVDLKVIALTGEEDEQQTETERYRRIRLWLSEKDRIPVRVEMEVFVGAVTLELTAVE